MSHQMASEGPKNTVTPGRGPRGWPGRRGLRVTPRTALCRPPACGWIRARPLARGPACRPAGLQGQAAQAPPLRVSTQPPALPLGGGLRVSLGVTGSLQGEQGAGKVIAGERAPVTSGYPRGRRAPAEQPLSAQGAPSALGRPGAWQGPSERSGVPLDPGVSLSASSAQATCRQKARLPPPRSGPCAPLPLQRHPGSALHLAPSLQGDLSMRVFSWLLIGFGRWGKSGTPEEVLGPVPAPPCHPCFRKAAESARVCPRGGLWPPPL